MVRLVGALSNEFACPKLEPAARAYARIAARGLDRKPARRPALRLPMGAIQNAVLDVLREVGRPLTLNEIRAHVGVRLRVDVSYDTVGSFLSVASRDSGVAVLRVARGRYAWDEAA